MRSQFVVIGSIVLAVAVARDNRASACSTTDDDTELMDQQFFMCQGNPNPLPDPISGLMDPRPSIYFARFGRLPIPQPPPGCMSPNLREIPPPDCQSFSCPDVNTLQGTGLNQWSFFIQDNDRWHLDDGEWDAHGKNDTMYYDLNQPYSKILNSAYLAYFGLKDNENLMFHGTQDYVNLLRANGSIWHDEFFRSMDLDPSEYFSLFTTIGVGDDEIASACPLYDASGKVFNNLVFRLDIQLHEAWHAWENANVDIGGRAHLPGLTGECTVGGDEACDPFYPHPLATFHPFGRLHEANYSVTPGCPFPDRFCVIIPDTHKFHSPSQVAVEFNCDLMNSPADWVTDDLLSVAAASQYEMREYLTKTPPFDCGGASPMMSPI